MSDTVDIWYVLPDAIRNPDLLEGYKGLLSADETARYQRFWFDRDRHLHLVAWALVRTTLSRYAGISPEAWEFRINRYGRPEIAGPGDTPPLRFNLSHTRGLIACIVATELDVGVDVEDRRRDTQGPEIARRYFSDREVAAFEGLGAEQQQLAFFEYWTLKESIIKALGLQIASGLSRFCFNLGTDTIRARFGEPISEDPAGWQFLLREIGADHLLAASLRTASGRPLTIEVRETVPLVS